MPATNLHGSAIVLADRGILILGPSGSGKSALALALLCAKSAMGSFGRLVSDDQVFAAVSAGRLVCTAPASIAGLVEIRGLGPTPLAHEARAVIDLAVRLVPAAEAPRLGSSTHENVMGLALPSIVLPERDAGNPAAVMAKLAFALSG